MLKKIVVIEDDELIRENVVDYLSLYSFDVKGFGDGECALEAIEKELPDLILCDISLPGLSGYEILNHLKEKDKISEVPFIFLSAHAEKSDVRKSMDMGADDYLIKPFTMKQLLASVNSRIEKSEKSKLKVFKQLNDKLQNFPKILSHELNTPLNGILGLTTLLLENLYELDKEEIKQYLQGILSSANRLSKTKEKLLVFFELLNESRPMTGEFYYLEQLQSNVVKHITTMAENKNRVGDIKFNLLDVTNQEQLKVQIPSDYLLVILEEQIENALKFTPEQSIITVNFKLNKLEFTIEVINEGELRSTLNPNLNCIEVNNSLYGSQGFGLGVFIVNKLCSMFNCKFTLTEDKPYIVAKTKMLCSL